MGELVRAHRENERLWEERGREVMAVCEERQARREDVRAIESLENELVRRECLLERERKEHLNCRLELENMEDIYERIFVSSNCPSRSKGRNFKIKRVRNSSVLQPSNFSALLPANH